MALGAYIDEPSYAQRVTSTGEAAGGGQGTQILREQLEAAARVLDHELGCADGAFLEADLDPTHDDETLEFDGQGSARLRLIDGEGLHFMAQIAAEGIAVDLGADGNYSLRMDLDDAWVRGLPLNAARSGRPYDAIELLPITGASIYTWPLRKASVRVIGRPGWRETPDTIAELNAFIARDMRERLTAASAGNYQMLENGVVVRDDTWRLLLKMKQAYTHRLPGLG